MNRDKLREAEASFLQRYPGGFADPGMKAIKKKHNVDKLIDFSYSPTPFWDFYQGYRNLIVDIKKEVAPTLSPNNAALTGFLMMTL